MLYELGLISLCILLFYLAYAVIVAMDLNIQTHHKIVLRKSSAKIPIEIDLGLKLYR